MDKWLNHPTALKIISFLVALLLWAVVHIDQDTPATVVTASTETKVFEAVPIRAEGLDETRYALVDMEPTVVRMVVEGRRSELLTASDSDYQIKADLSGLGPGEHTITLKEKLPKGVQVTDMSPRTVKVEIVEIETKAFAPQVITEGTPANGYKAGTPVITPDKVNVTLPKDEMPFVGSVQAKVNVDGANKPITSKKAEIVVYDTEGKEMTDAKVEPSTVDIDLPVLPPSKSLPLKMSFTGTVPDGIGVDSVYISEKSVLVYAEQKVLDSLDSYVGVNVDLSKLKESGSMKVKVKLADGVVKTEPSEVTLNYRVSSSQTNTIAGVPIAYTGLGDGLTAAWKTPASGLMDVTVSGSPNTLNGLQPSSIKLTADLNGLGPGTHDINLGVELPPFVHLADGQQLHATIVISDGSVPASGGGSPSGPGSGANAGQGAGTGSGSGSSSDPHDGANGGSNNAGAGSGQNSGGAAGSGNAGESAAAGE
ncbi:CdaR family protein [Paenibacillus protaetiae]|uniref:YbbR-like domain-containing protein n=1 Tax=Paenibacillus protaetiae TaxID=2509456 RepID=A0A4P6F1B3_9BACL|nr:CdaR family protein [Paenibacillus protaetiae]QAY67909.1 hypothetical protein ET464_17480 [Paenibacillus protaetiae]